MFFRRSGPRPRSSVALISPAAWRVLSVSSSWSVVALAAKRAATFTVPPHQSFARRRAGPVWSPM